MIQLTHVSKRYSNGIVAVKDASLRIEQGEFVYIIGPSGSGKSTLMKLMYRDERLSKGKLTVGPYQVHAIKNRHIPKLRRHIGVIFQDFKLLPKLTVYENVAYALEVTGAKKKVIKERVREVLHLVGLTRKANQFPDELSGGEQQRVAIARALANEPSIIIADEPTGNLDPKTAREIFEVLETINAQGTTVIMGTHNNQLGDQYKHRVIQIEAGRIVSDEVEGDYNL